MSPEDEKLAKFDKLSEFAPSAFAAKYFDIVLTIEANLLSLSVLRQAGKNALKSLSKEDRQLLYDVDALAFQRLMRSVKETLSRETPLSTPTKVLQAPAAESVAAEASVVDSGV
jgi:hypothetical protein